jgi:CheY-like chemotaxis protein
MRARVLLIEDDADTARLIAAALRTASFEVTVAFSAQTALQEMARGSFDGVLLDYRLPDIPGLDSLQEVRRNHPDLPAGLELLHKIRREHPDLPVVVLTAWGSEDLARQALKKLGATDYIPKHGRYLSEVVTAVHEALRHAIFRSEGGYWTIAYGGTLRQLPDMKGYHYLVPLLRQPGTRFNATDLVAVDAQPVDGPTHIDTDTEGLRIAADLGDSGPALDPQARAAYRNRLAELAEELAEVTREIREAIDLNDLGGRAKWLAERERISEEQEFIERQLNTARGDRRVGTHEERARLIVTKNIKAAVERIGLSHPRLAYHLKISVKTGYTCVYLPNPEQPISWVL